MSDGRARPEIVPAEGFRFFCEAERDLNAARDAFDEAKARLDQNAEQLARQVYEQLTKLPQVVREKLDEIIVDNHGLS